jgi:hypothetical protein
MCRKGWPKVRNASLSLPVSSKDAAFAYPPCAAIHHVFPPGSLTPPRRSRSPSWGDGSCTETPPAANACVYGDMVKVRADKNILPELPGSVQIRLGSLDPLTACPARGCSSQPVSANNPLTVSSRYLSSPGYALSRASMVSWSACLNGIFWARTEGWSTAKLSANAENRPLRIVVAGREELAFGAPSRLF